MTYDKFVAYYRKYGRCINQMSKPKHTLREAELKAKYKAYVKKLDKQPKGYVVDEKWEALKVFVHKRDNNQCRFLSKLYVDDIEAFNYIKSTVPYNILNTLDLAHVISRTKSKNLYYEADNLINLNRFSHSQLDSYHNPIYGTVINNEQRIAWFKYIIGDSLYEDLLKRK